MNARKLSYSTRLAIFLWAFACGTPLLLLTTTLSVRLVQAHLSVDKIGLYSFAIAPYALKFFLGPFVEKVTLPLLSQLIGRVRAWMVYAMTGIITGFVLMGLVNLQHRYGFIALWIATSFTALCAALNDTAEAEYRIELLDSHELASGSACYSVGYNLGAIIASSVALLMAHVAGWRTACLCMILPIIMGIVVVMVKPHKPRPPISNRIVQMSSYRWLECSIKNLLKRLPSKWLLLLIFLYYAPSYLLLMVTNPFYLHLGFSATQIGFIGFTLNVPTLLIGGLLGAYLCQRYSIVTVLRYAILGYIISLLLLLILNLFSYRHSITLLAASMGFTYLVDSVSIVAYVSLLASLCKVPFTATQNALLTSVMALAKMLFSSIGAFVVHAIGYTDVLIMVLFLLFGFIVVMKPLSRIHIAQQDIQFQPTDALPDLE